MGRSLSGEQWGTVREDYGPYGDAWHYFPYEYCISGHTAGAKMALLVSLTFSRTSVFCCPLERQRCIYEERLFGLGSSQN